MFCLWNFKKSSGQNFCPDSSLIDLRTWMIQDLFFAKTYFLFLPYFFSNSGNTLRQKQGAEDA
jgi:hypothetical protein